ncbi:MAG: hypothetical protein PHG95_01910 [Patescibacteria group bacterium]|nr:hypothetical protein [Patescibacteria group bacterium]
MKKFFENHIKGLVWFVIFYALLRILFSHPNTYIQGKDMFAAIIGSVAFIWLIFPSIMSDNNLPLRLSFLSVSGYSLFTWTKFDAEIFSSGWFQNLNDDKITLLATVLIFVLSFIISIIDFVSAWKESGKMGVLWLAPLWFVLITAIIVAGDYFLPTLIPW